MNTVLSIKTWLIKISFQKINMYTGFLLEFFYVLTLGYYLSNFWFIKASKFWQTHSLKISYSEEPMLLEKILIYVMVIFS